MSTPRQDRILDAALRIVDPIIRITPAPRHPTVENTEVWARGNPQTAGKSGQFPVIHLDQLDNETSVIDSATLRKLLVKSGYEYISAHQKKDTE